MDNNDNSSSISNSKVFEKKIVINPVTRIEGHAQIDILLNEDNSVKEALFKVTDFRGFEKFTEGRPYYEMPAITSRSCGICPVSHILASAKACDAIVGVTPPKTAVMLRRLMHMGQLIQSHALNFFHLSSPDLLFGFDSDPAKRNVFGLIEKHPDFAVQGVKLRRFGQEIIEKVAGKRVHSSEWVQPGGVKWPLTRERVEYLQGELPKASEITKNTLTMFKQIVNNFEDEVENFGNFPSYYMGLVNSDGGLEHYDGKLRIMDKDGNAVAECTDALKYQEYIGEAVEPYTFMKFPYFKKAGYTDGAYRVGPLARLNVASHCGTPLADEEIKEFKKLGKNGIVHSTFHYHYARLIETLFCIENAKKLLEDPEILSENVTSRAMVNNYEGVGIAEAPRGTLIHHYKVDTEGMITWNNMIIATEHNNIAYNKAITQVAKKYVKTQQLQEGMLNRVEAVIRAFDPCLSCATHAVGQMTLDIKLFDTKGTLLDRQSR
ncbi:MAG: Ni/Fe hydrogenase subunit alpha [Nitrososphaerota archaeon]|jgi:NAD-reducing hydrogenase large subunit|nr:Ni/Fe hydrogenase subunit alpha [Nitrososphaerota archaeon]